MVRLSAFLIASCLHAQTGTLSIKSGKIDFSTATHTATVIVVANVGALPATGCTVGELAIVMAASLGQQIYENSGSGACVWTQQSTSPTGTAGGALAGSYPNPSIATLDQDLLFVEANNRNIGAAGATRPQDIFARRNITAGSTMSAAVFLGGNFSAPGSSFSGQFFQDQSNAKGYWDTGTAGFNWLNQNRVTTNVNVAMRAIVAQTADLEEWLNSGGAVVASTSPAGAYTATTYNTITNCSSAGGTCVAAPVGSVTIAAGSTTVTVSTTAVTANSQILLMFDASLSAKLGVTCNTTVPALYGVTARTAATSFVITATSPAVNPACFSYFIVN